MKWWTVQRTDDRPVTAATEFQVSARGAGPPLPRVIVEKLAATDAGTAVLAEQVRRYQQGDATWQPLIRALWDKHVEAPTMTLRSMTLRSNPRSPVADYKRKHWGVPATTEYQVKHPALPTGYTLPEIGKLLELRVRGRTGKGPGNRMRVVRIEPTQPAHLAYSPDQVTRLFCVLRPEDNAELARDYGDDDSEWVMLNQVHRARGGRQADWPYAHDVPVKVLGVLHAVVYHTDKGSYEGDDEPDGPSDYIHEMGTEGDEPPVKPLLCMDAHGYLYLAGGSYVVEDRGIVN